MGMWTGMLNNKVGNFKFIYVDVISEEAAPKKMKTQRRSGMEKPERCREFLERIHLQVSKHGLFDFDGIQMELGRMDHCVLPKKTKKYMTYNQGKSVFQGQLLFTHNHFFMHGQVLI